MKVSLLYRMARWGYDSWRKQLWSVTELLMNVLCMGYEIWNGPFM
jgi:hypothetical protein